MCLKPIEMVQQRRFVNGALGVRGFKDNPVATQIDAGCSPLSNAKPVLNASQKVRFATDILPRWRSRTVLLEVSDLRSDPPTLAANPIVDLLYRCIDRRSDIH